jgi:ATP-dependent Clp protease ATP-binding subunit ClpC
MFEKFTDRARQAVVHAQEQARQLNHNYIGTEHILLGLIREGDGLAAEALAALGISLEAARQEIEAIIGRGTEPPSAHIPFTPRSKKVLELALGEAHELGHEHIGTGHILLGLIRERDGVAAQVLVRRDIDLDRARQQVIQLLAGQPGGPTAGEGEMTIAGGGIEEVKDDDEIGRLRREIERLRALLRAHDIDPGAGYGD